MALVTVQRSPSVGSSPPSSESGAGISIDEEDGNRSKSLSECYFAGKSAALVLPPNEKVRPGRGLSSSGSDIQQHLQSMFYLLRPEETLKMAVKLESVHPGRTRYLVVVSCIGRQDAEECCLLGIDCNEKTTIGLVLRILADTTITLDGDGGFSVCVCGRQHIFKPVSVQAMWSALQTIHKVSSKAREQNYFLGGLTHDWVRYYEQKIESDRSCLNEWHAMDSIESKRPPSPDSVRSKPSQREETERVIRCTLKEIMMSVDLDEVTSKHIRGRLEEELDMDLGEFKPFIDEEMLTILGQMDAATEIFDHVYLGSEWNASNHEELQKNGVRHILNVTREIDNFFPGMFNYLNIRVYDDEKTDLLKHWDDTFKYISRARAEGSKVLVHCKMGVSRSASVVIAYAMKAYNWDFKKAYEYVKKKRNCIKPNCSFMSQLETYQGILDAMKNKEKLQRSKSETNLKSPCLIPKDNTNPSSQGHEKKKEKISRSLLSADWMETSGFELSRVGGRPKSWSPANSEASMLFTDETPGPTSVSMEYLNSDDRPESNFLNQPPNTEMCPTCRTRTRQDELPCKECFKVTTKDHPQSSRNHNSHLRIPCENGQTYSVSQNRIVYLPGLTNPEKTNFVPYVRNRVIEFESQSGAPNSETCALYKKSNSDRKGLVLNLTSQFESTSSKSTSPTDCDKPPTDAAVTDAKLKNPHIVNSILVREEVWDPGEKKANARIWPLTSEELGGESELPYCERAARAGRREGDPFSDKLDRVFDREERKQGRPTFVSVPESGYCSAPVETPSRQNSWSSYDSAVALSFPGDLREAPSRQSSWGSADLRKLPGTLPSSNSSWGSYDLRSVVQPFGEKSEESIIFTFSKDMPWNPNSVKRTKQKLEVIQLKDDTEEDSESSSSKTEISVCSLKLHGPKPYQTPVFLKDLKPLASRVVETVNPVLVHYASTPSLLLQPSLENTSKSSDKMTISQPNITLLQEETFTALQCPDDGLQLSASAPETYTSSLLSVDTTQCCSVRQQKLVLENLTNKPYVLPKRYSEDTIASSFQDQSKPEMEGQMNVLGMVQNLKKEFEAKSASKSENGNEGPKQSPVGNQQDSPPEDLSVKNLVGKYEIKKNQHDESELFSKKSQPVLPPSRKQMSVQPQFRAKHSSLFFHNLKNSNSNSGEKVLVLDRPSAKTPSPSVVVASVVAKAASKKQQGKTHPLAHLTINSRHSNAVYNTM